MFFTNLGLHDRIGTSEFGSRADFLRRFRIWGQTSWIFASRGQHLGKSTWEISKYIFGQIFDQIFGQVFVQGFGQGFGEGGNSSSKKKEEKPRKKQEKKIR